jgi:hypothetical protein
MTDRHIAQINIARAVAPLTDPQMAGFVARLADINALADQSPGFVWRLQTDTGDATSLRAFYDPLIIVNMSVWESLEALHDFTWNCTRGSVARSKALVREVQRPLLRIVVDTIRPRAQHRRRQRAASALGEPRPKRNRVLVRCRVARSSERIASPKA